MALPAWVWWETSRIVLKNNPYAEDSLSKLIILRGSAALAFVEIGCMAWWLLGLRRSAREQRILSLVFRFGALFAGCWSLVSLAGLVALLGEPERDMLWKSPMAMVFVSPFACVVVYWINSRLARERAGSFVARPG